MNIVCFGIWTGGESLTWIKFLNSYRDINIADIWGKIQVYPPKNFLSPISLKIREIILLVNLF